MYLYKQRTNRHIHRLMCTDTHPSVYTCTYTVHLYMFTGIVVNTCTYRHMADIPVRTCTWQPKGHVSCRRHLRMWQHNGEWPCKSPACGSPAICPIRAVYVHVSPVLDVYKTLAAYVYVYIYICMHALQQTPCSLSNSWFNLPAHCTSVARRVLRACILPPTG
jgi:hypothetical protein